MRFLHLNAFGLAMSCAGAGVHVKSACQVGWTVVACSSPSGLRIVIVKVHLCWYSVLSVRAEIRYKLKKRETAMR